MLGQLPRLSDNWLFVLARVRVACDRPHDRCVGQKIRSRDDLDVHGTGLSRLCQLNIAGNYITDFSPLDHLSNLVIEGKDSQRGG